MESGSNAVSDKILHSLENASGNDDPVNDGGESVFGQHYVSGGSCSISGTSHGNSHVGPLESRSVVHTVSRHAHLEPHLSQTLNNEVLVFGKYLSKTVSVANEITKLFCHIRWRFFRDRIEARQTVGISNDWIDNPKTVFCTQMQHSSSFHRDAHVVSGDHLHLDAKLPCPSNGVLGVVSRRVGESQ